MRVSISLVAGLLLVIWASLLEAETQREQLARLIEQLAASQGRVQLQGMVEQYGYSAGPDETTLRQRIIRLAQELKPPPAIPEAARRPFVEGTVVLRAAKDEKQFSIAIASFKEALRIAPWWGDAYFNLGVAQETASQFSEAEASFGFYLLTNPGEKEAREAQDRIYGLGAKRRLAAVEQEDKKKKQSVEDIAMRFSGTWKNHLHSMTLRIEGSRCDVLHSGYGFGGQMERGEIRRVNSCSVTGDRLQANMVGIWPHERYSVLCEFTLDGESRLAARYVAGAQHRSDPDVCTFYPFVRQR